MFIDEQVDVIRKINVHQENLKQLKTTKKQIQECEWMDGSFKDLCLKLVDSYILDLDGFEMDDDGNIVV